MDVCILVVSSDPEDCRCVVVGIPHLSGCRGDWSIGDWVGLFDQLPIMFVAQQARMSPVASDLTPTTEAHAGEHPLVDPKDVKVFFFKAFMVPMVWY